jgi:carotenoid cleavage dioxygenase
VTSAGSDHDLPSNPEVPEPSAEAVRSPNLSPVSVESTIDGPLPMDGAIPDGLEGLLVRIGPNATTVSGGVPWANGDGMVHAVELRDGVARSYRNRWVRTRRLADVLGTLGPPGPAEPVDGVANANVVWIAGRLLALSECGLPHRLGTDLRTLRIDDFDSLLESPISPHPHRDPETGAVALLGYDPFGPPYLRYHELDDDGAVVHSTELDVARCSLQPDFAVTASRVTFLDLPAILDERSGPPAEQVGPPEVPAPSFRWSPEHGARLGVLDRGAHGADVIWIDVEPCFVSHVVNAFDEDHHLVIDVCRYEAFGADGVGHGGAGRPHLERWTVDPGARKVEMTQLDDRAVELPRVDALCASRPYRYAYCVELDEGAFAEPVGLVRYDLMRDEAVHRRLEGRWPNEPVFVRAHDGHADDEGWLLVVVYDEGRGASDLVILDASSMAGNPEAVIHLPVRVPLGLHGSWVPISEYR